MVFERIRERLGRIPRGLDRISSLFYSTMERIKGIEPTIKDHGWDELPEYIEMRENLDLLVEKLRELDNLVVEKGIINIVKIPITIYVAGLTSEKVGPRLLCARTNTTIEVPEVTEGVAWTSEAVFKAREVLNKILKDKWVQTALFDNIDDAIYPQADQVKLQASIDEPSRCVHMARIRSIPSDIQAMFNLDEIAEKHRYERVEDKYILR